MRNGLEQHRRRKARHRPTGHQGHTDAESPINENEHGEKGLNFAEDFDASKGGAEQDAMPYVWANDAKVLKKQFEQEKEPVTQFMNTATHPSPIECEFDSIRSMVSFSFCTSFRTHIGCGGASAVRGGCNTHCCAIARGATISKYI